MILGADTLRKNDKNVLFTSAKHCRFKQQQTDFKEAHFCMLHSIVCWRTVAYNHTVRKEIQFLRVCIAMCAHRPTLEPPFASPIRDDLAM